ncbi:MAG TPA: hypothetical protein VI386_20665 [Candidatus Sulfotelmatobacter sp.]
MLEDANSVQMALMQVMQMLAMGRIEHKTASLLLYGLQTASANLRSTKFEALMVTDVVIDRDTVHLTAIDGPQWFEEDFDEEESDEEESDEEESGEEESEEDDSEEEEADAQEEEEEDQEDNDEDESNEEDEDGEEDEEKPVKMPVSAAKWGRVTPAPAATTPVVKVAQSPVDRMKEMLADADNGVRPG